MDIHDLLKAREDRAAFQQDLLALYGKPLLTHRVNTPGPDKNLPASLGIFNAVEAALAHRLQDAVLFEQRLDSAEGPVMIRVVDMTAEALKAAAISLEDTHPLGRFVDLDVYSIDGTSPSRTEMGYAARCCYLCDHPAHECARSRRHSLAELLEEMEKGYRMYDTVH